ADKRMSQRVLLPLDFGIRCGVAHRFKEPSLAVLPDALCIAWRDSKPAREVAGGWNYSACSSLRFVRRDFNESRPPLDIHPIQSQDFLCAQPSKCSERETRSEFT